MNKACALVYPLVKYTSLAPIEWWYSFLHRPRSKRFPFERCVSFYSALLPLIPSIDFQWRAMASSSRSQLPTEEDTCYDHRTTSVFVSSFVNAARKSPSFFRLPSGCRYWRLMWINPVHPDVLYHAESSGTPRVATSVIGTRIEGWVRI